MFYYIWMEFKFRSSTCRCKNNSTLTQQRSHKYVENLLNFINYSLKITADNLAVTLCMLILELGASRRQTYSICWSNSKLISAQTLTLSSPCIFYCRFFCVTVHRIYRLLLLPHTNPLIVSDWWVQNFHWKNDSPSQFKHLKGINPSPSSPSLSADSNWTPWKFLHERIPRSITPGTHTHQ